MINEQQIRVSQAIHTYGPGAIADFPELSVLILAHDFETKYWGENEELPSNLIADDRLANAFNVEGFVRAPTNGVKIKSMRFPSILRCPKTNQLFDVKELEANHVDRHYLDPKNQEYTVDKTFRGYRSPNAKDENLVPVRWVIASEEGYLDDFPFDWFIHVKLGLHDDIGKGNKLFLHYSGKSASLSDIELESKKGTKSLGKFSLGKIFDQVDTFVDLKNPKNDYLQYVKNRLPLPWLGRKADGSYRTDLIDNINYPPFDETEPENSLKRQIALSKYPRTILRGAGNLYFPIVFKGVCLPKSGYSTSIPDDLVVSLKRFIQKMEDIGLETNSDKVLELISDRLEAGKYENLGYSDQDILNYAKEYLEEEPEDSQMTVNRLREQEFDCFLKPDINVQRKEWYKSKIIDGSSYDFGIPGLVDNVVLLDKIKELKIFRGFTRVKPLGFEDLIFESKTSSVQNDYRSRELSRIRDAKLHYDTPTLPCSEVKGEGIFIKFNSDILNGWQDRPSVQDRFSIIERNNSHYRREFNLPEDEVLSAKYVFLHTLSHVIINELSIECGYGSSALTEIIYSSKEKEMDGILIYTSASDSEGTMGGLVEKGSPQFLSQIINNAIGKSKWCGSDPLCIENESGKGFMGLNLGACHSCCLLPETSCSNMNKYLDRAMLVGTIDDESIGVFNNK